MESALSSAEENKKGGTQGGDLPLRSHRHKERLSLIGETLSRKVKLIMEKITSEQCSPWTVLDWRGLALF